MTVTIAHDAIHANIHSLPPGQSCGYTTGSEDIRWTTADWLAHPVAVRICQDIGATDSSADVLDVERGAATPADCPGWAKRAQAAFSDKARTGQRTPAIYTSGSQVTAVVNALKAGGVTSGVSLWVANWSIGENAAADDVMHGSGPFPVIGVQFASNNVYDTDVFSVAWLSHTAGDPPPPKPPAPVLVTVPITFGKPARAAITAIEAVGLTVSTDPFRDPIDTYTSAGSTPIGGSKVPKGTRVILHVKKA